MRCYIRPTAALAAVGADLSRPLPIYLPVPIPGEIIESALSCSDNNYR